MQPIDHGVLEKSGGSGGEADPIDALGRAMTKILRHEAATFNLDLRSDGYCKVDELLKIGMKTRAGIPLSSHSVEEVLQAVKQDNKQRFSTTREDGTLYIRANQGHSIKEVLSDHLLREISSTDKIPVCIHGTYKHALPSILESGLKVMGRNHVHFATGLPDENGVISGMRSSCQVLIYLDTEKAMADGMKFYVSDNNVVLTEGFEGCVPCEYFEKVVEWPSKRVIVGPLDRASPAKDARQL
ncbi:putative tRNA 2'-phosphotransferase isoform X2 [Selaginella moellendorffii]|uniref:putative tRNA 2'-phosphotransferase isoform X2 n=1 Tax=Selaginella moellendorffii TaxID=88036 RepID=UPI000D1CA965|nr:putative tRNA 2'-phosphotransferase isoform X2 [Selaginella moellendorffii]|eukprot:XP_024539348.1 putative tRNA 2'-phosphotransferase isoform X2 [Selaginella moellendorffii]